uniref:Uncharacterized protein n=1 Tax=Proboscia inermis TaxID=420281 RepID=A0A6T8HH97_9STRA|mmetsp:Transcript_20732/g.21022  ORF Transcript_20732/g.21022 Transcript_20732/m.21022 type:complete len:169 (+) Transcript_20732:838-1344(+)
MFSLPFAAFTIFNLGLTLWQLSEIKTKTGKSSKTKDTIWFEDSMKNTLLVEFAYLFWMQIQMGALLYTGCTVNKQVFWNFMDRFPQMYYLLSNLALNTAFFNNLAVLLATLLRYKLVSKPRHDNIIVFSLPLFSSIFIVWKVFRGFFGTEGGAMSSSFLTMLFNAAAT